MKILYAALLSILPPLAAAQTPPPGLQPLPEPPPMASGQVTDEPAINIRRRDGSVVEEYRANGKLYMIKITPENAPPYFLVDEKGDGQFLRRESIGGDFKPPRWVLFRF